jgi:hypothetical protein
MDAKTKTGQAVVSYLNAHPDEDSPARIVKETGCTRNTARAYLRAHQAKRAKEGAVTGQTVAPPPLRGGEDAQGRDFTKDFPAPVKAEKPKAPPKTAEDVLEDEPETDEDDEGEEDDDGLLGLF